MSSLALDVGGTFVKGARIEGGRVVGAVVRRQTPDFLDTEFAEGARELSPAQLDAVVREVLDDLGVSDISSHDVLISGQMAGLAFIDSQGRAVENIITWQDTRYQGVDAVAEAMGQDTVADLGDGLRVGSPAVTLANRQVSEGAYPTSLIAYVAGRIAGQRAENIHATDAGAWGLFDTRRMRWSSVACQVTGVDEALLPRVTQRVEPVAPGARVFTAVGDQQAALFGAELTEDQVSVNLATGCQVSILAHDFAATVQTRPYLDDHYLHTVTHLPSGRLLAAAVAKNYGDTSEDSWARAVDEFPRSSRIEDAVDAIAGGVAEAVERFHAAQREVLFSGGLVQRFGPLRERLLSLLGSPPHAVFAGEDAAIAGLASLSVRQSR